MSSINCQQVHVIHVSKGYENRKRFIDEQMSELDISFQYVLKGDISDISEDIEKELFSNEHKLRKAEMSCAYKHYLAIKCIADSGEVGGLVFEDDIVIDKKFSYYFNQSLNEAFTKNAPDFLINYERYSKFIPLLKLRLNKHLYKMPKTKLAGAYYISRSAAVRYIDYINENKMHMPADWLQTYIFQALDMTIYWHEPTLAEQGSKNGTFDSDLSNRKASTLKKFSWNLNQLYKRYLLRLFRWY